MKLKEGFILEPIESDMNILIPLGDASHSFHGVIRLNDTAAFIVEKLLEETDEETLIRALDAEYNGSREQFSESIHRTLDMLRQAGALIE